MGFCSPVRHRGRCILDYKSLLHASDAVHTCTRAGSSAPFSSLMYAAYAASSVSSAGFPDATEASLAARNVTAAFALS